MKYEVEKKFPVADLAALKERLESLGAGPFQRLEEVDTYFAHPARDFRETDEAFRIRRVNERCVATYKGPRVDRETKTRREIELPLGEGDATQASWREMLEALGFMAFGQVRKVRLLATIEWEGRTLAATLDDVDEVGTYCELEIVADESDLDEAKRIINDLADRLELTGNETRSYLNLLMTNRGVSTR